uniref:Uncharacterized protein n=1 Tax=Arundo donax TaxID=35708 RepID=A0A0A9H1N9_ARUDO
MLHKVRTIASLSTARNDARLHSFRAHHKILVE